MCVPVHLWVVQQSKWSYRILIQLFSCFHCLPPLLPISTGTDHTASVQYAAGDWPNQRAGGLDGLANWTAANRSIENTDIVLWYTVGFHHITLQENLPVLPASTFWGAEFDLMPANFFQSTRWTSHKPQILEPPVVLK